MSVQALPSAAGFRFKRLPAQALIGLLLLSPVLASASGTATGPAARPAPAAASTGTAAPRTGPDIPGRPVRDPDRMRMGSTVNRVQATYARMETLQADFVQTLFLSNGKTRVDSGSLELKKGGRMRWDFAKPTVRQFISDGKMLWMYTPDEKQVLETTLAAGTSQTALNFMSGLGSLSRDFGVELAKEAQYQRPGMTALHLTPKEQLGTVSRLTILAGDEDGMVHEAFVKDPMGTVTQIVFSNLKLNSPVADGRFTFTPPQGVQVLRQ
jgi:outer membrane lipoprotein carrier protein